MATALKKQATSDALLDSDRTPNLTLKQYEPLIEMLIDPNQTLIAVLCDTTDLCDGDKLAKLLFHIFESQGQTTLLLKQSINHEIEKCSKSSLLFRNNSICSKMLTVWARLLGNDYLKKAVGNCIVGINNSTANFEVDPNRVKEEGVNLETNMQNLEGQVNQFFSSILASISDCPAQFKQICYYLQSLTINKFPEAGYFVVAGFFFLRFICPAIVTPPTYNLLTTFPKKESHRGLVLVAKVLQNLANGVDFKKEPFMEPLNSFLTSNQSNFQTFIDQLSSSENPEGIELPSLNQPGAAQLANVTELHQFLMKNVTRTMEALSNAPDTTEREIQAVNKLRDLLFEFEKMEKVDAAAVPKEKKVEINLFGETPPREVVLNVERSWSDSVRLPAVVSVELVSRAKHLCESNPMQCKYPAHPVDWQGISDSIDFSEFVLDAAELQKVDISKLNGQKDTLAFWINVVNIMVIHIHVVNGPPTTKSRRKTMFHTYKYEIGFQRFSIEDIIEGILRGNPKGHFKKKDARCDFAMQQYDPRFHFGISYLTASSPTMRVYRPDTISQQLNSSAEDFLKGEVSVDKKKIHVPQLLEKYYQDFGTYQTDIFKWLGKYLEPHKIHEISAIIATTHYSIDFVEPSWEARKGGLFGPDNVMVPRASIAEKFSRDFPTETIIQRCQSHSVTPTSKDGADELGLLNMEIKWTAESRHPLTLSTVLLRFLQGLCTTFLFEWGSVAGSQEFHAFLLNTAELQKADLKELQKHEALPFWLNIYHTLLLHLYVMKKPPGDMSVFGRKTFFSTYKYNVGGSEYSLKDIEEGIIRGHIHKKFKSKDPRFKYAVKSDPRAICLISCMTKSSPVLRIFSGDDFETVQTRCTQYYVREHARIDPDKKKISVPESFKDLYDNDFRGKKDELVMWMSQYLNGEQRLQLEQLFSAHKKFSLAFDDFDWTPNPVFEEA